MQPAWRSLSQHCVTAARQIADECSRFAEGNDGIGAAATTGGLAGCDPPLVELLGRQARSVVRLSEASGDIPTVLMTRRLDDLISISYRKFYAYRYSDLPACWRQLYTDASILKFAVPPLRLGHDGHLPEPCLDEMVRTLDLALILAGAAGEQRGAEWINHALQLLHDAWAAQYTSAVAASSRPPKRARTKSPGDDSNWAECEAFSTHEPFTPPVRYPIPRVRDMDMERFQAYLDQPTPSGPEPLVIQGLTDAWPARTAHPWHKPGYLLSRTFGGRRTVPVEIGRSYVDPGWTQKLMRFSDLLSEHIMTTTTKTATGYLAQHALLMQVPALRSDVAVPDLCYTAPPGHPTDASQDQAELDTPRLNAWFGPAGTITPLHTDPYHNLLAQVVGRKYVRLYSPAWSASLAPRGTDEAGVDMANTSRADVGALEGWDATRPEGGPGGTATDGIAETESRFQEEDGLTSEEEDLIRSAPFVDCILEPGDTLYIPIGWWHYVRGLSVSFSVSFWWN